MTRSGALRSLDILDECERRIFDTEDSDEICAKVGNHRKLGSWVHNYLMREGGCLTRRVDGFVCVRERARGLDYASGTDTEGVDTMTTTTGTVSTQEKKPIQGNLG